MDLLLALAGLGDVVGGLHAHERIHLHPESLLDAQRHISGKTLNGTVTEMSARRIEAEAVNGVFCISPQKGSIQNQRVDF